MHHQCINAGHARRAFAAPEPVRALRLTRSLESPPACSLRLEFRGHCSASGHWPRLFAVAAQTRDARAAAMHLQQEFTRI
jgi:hypothetical protein